MRVTLARPPFENLDKSWGARGRWPADWIASPAARVDQPGVTLFRRHFNLTGTKSPRIHVSADNRYELYLDGQRLGRGPERGDRLNWFFESYDLDLAPGAHTLVARTWFLGTLAPMAQISIRPGFLLCPDDAKFVDTLATGHAEWECLDVSSHYEFRVDKAFNGFTGARQEFAANDFPHRWRDGEFDAGPAPIRAGDAYNDRQQVDQPNAWVLRPALLPPMFSAERRFASARHVERMPPEPITLIDPARNDVELISQWNRLLAGTASLEIPANTAIRAILDFDDYVCGYPNLRVAMGAGATIGVRWAESLYEKPGDNGRFEHKGNRDLVEGKHFFGDGDTFALSGDECGLDTLWWSAGRYVELTITTKDSPLSVQKLGIDDEHFPYDWKGRFEASDARLADVIPLGKRVMEMCSHETYMDCPYYEQLQYVGDTRLEVLVAHTWTGDARLPRKAIDLFDKSRKSPGFTQSRYPSRMQQIIPPFSLWWVAMLHDFAMWQDDLPFVRSMLPSLRGVIDAALGFLNSDGLLEAPKGWNFVDWVPGWDAGMPLDADLGVSGVLNLHLIHTLRLAAQLETDLGESELAALQSRRADAVAKLVVDRFWNAPRGLFADDLKHSRFSEHAQCLAQLAEVGGAQRHERMVGGLLKATDLARTTVYFDFYLFETLSRVGRIDRVIDRLSLWFDMKRNGFKTTAEQPEPSRSDCHAWGAHPLFHFLASICGIRPASPGFKTVRIEPQIGPLEWARGTMCHPKGVISIDLDRKRSIVELPDNVSGHFIQNGPPLELRPGRNTIDA